MESQKRLWRPVFYKEQRSTAQNLYASLTLLARDTHNLEHARISNRHASRCAVLLDLIRQLHRTQSDTTRAEIAAVVYYQSQRIAENAPEPIEMDTPEKIVAFSRFQDGAHDFFDCHRTLALSLLGYVPSEFFTALTASGFGDHLTIGSFTQSHYSNHWLLHDPQQTRNNSDSTSGKQAVLIIESRPDQIDSILSIGSESFTQCRLDRLSSGLAAFALGETESSTQWTNLDGP